MTSAAAEAQLGDILQTSAQEKPPRPSTTGKILTGLTGAAALAITVISVPFLSPALRKHCLPYVPATNTQIKNVLAALQNRRGSLVDLGSGDGRIVLEAAKHGFVSHGVELNPWLVAYSRLDALRTGWGPKTRFFKQDLWKFSLQPYDNVVIFGVEQMMQDLEAKFVAECKDGCKVIACRFSLPSLRPGRIIGHGVDTVWVYDLSRVRG